MAKVVINITDAPRGISVECKVVPDEKDSELTQKVAATVGYGLAGHVNEKIRHAIQKKGKSNVH